MQWRRGGGSSRTVVVRKGLREDESVKAGLGLNLVLLRDEAHGVCLSCPGVGEIDHELVAIVSQRPGLLVGDVVRCPLGVLRRNVSELPHNLEELKSRGLPILEGLGVEVNKPAEETVGEADFGDKIEIQDGNVEVGEDLLNKGDMTACHLTINVGVDHRSSECSLHAAIEDVRGKGVQKDCLHPRLDKFLVNVAKENVLVRGLQANLQHNGGQALEKLLLGRIGKVVAASAKRELDVGNQKVRNLTADLDPNG